MNRDLLLLHAAEPFDCIHMLRRKTTNCVAVLPVIKSKHQLKPNAVFGCFAVQNSKPKMTIHLRVLQLVLFCQRLVP